MVALEENSRWGDVAVSEDFRGGLGIKGLVTVDAEDRVTLGVGAVGVRRLNGLLLLQIICTQLTDLALITDRRLSSDNIRPTQRREFDLSVHPKETKTNKLHVLTASLINHRGMSQDLACSCVPERTTCSRPFHICL